MECPFIKAEAAGNDFIIINVEDLPQKTDLGKLAVRLCKRKKSIGADGVLIYGCSNLEGCDLKMRIFNPDGQEVEMCGNGARCIAIWAKSKRPTFVGTTNQKSKIKIETEAGVLEAEVIGNNRVKLKMPEPRDISIDFNLELDCGDYRVSFVNTGVPHVVCFVEDLNNFDVKAIGQAIRYHKKFKPTGTNVDFVRILDEKNLEIRTYERGVEDETLACGTGAVASAIIFVQRSTLSTQRSPINVHTKSGEILRVYFDFKDGKISNVWLEGKAEIVYEGRMDYV